MVQRKQNETTGFAVRVLADPFPAPEVITVTCSKPAIGTKVGVHFRWNGGKGDRVQISKIAESSPLNETSLEVGHIVLSINGIAALTSTQSAQLIRDTVGPSVTVTAWAESSVIAPFCKVVTAPSCKQHPGVNFNSARGRCLVQVSRVFAKGPFAGSGLNVGDVVLALNGTPVSKPEDADRALREANNHPFTMLYVVNMKEYRDNVLEELQTSRAFHDARLIQDEQQSSHRSNRKDREVLFAFGEEVYAKLEFDFESQHLIDRDAHWRRKTSSTSYQQRAVTKFYGRVYRKMVLPFLEAYNDCMEARMRVLEEAVCCAAWKHEAATGQTRPEEDAFKSFTASLQHRHRTSAEASVVEQDEEPAVTVPVAAAEIEVLPMEALQSFNERSKNIPVRAAI